MGVRCRFPPPPVPPSGALVCHGVALHRVAVRGVCACVCVCVRACVYVRGVWLGRPGPEKKG